MSAQPPSQGYRSSTFWKVYDAIAEAVDQKRYWYKLPQVAGLAVLVGVRNVLRKKNLFDTNLAPTTGAAPVAPFEERFLTDRTADGSYNDLSDPAMGRAGARFGRNVPLEKAWPEPEPDIMEPNPRVVSRELLTRHELIAAPSCNAIVSAWLQFMIRDWFSHGKGDPNRMWRIEIGDDDDFPERPLEFPRTLPDPTRPDDDGHPPTYVNTETHWWDGSSIYGTSAEMQQRARAGEDGKLIVGADGRLPVDPRNKAIEEPGFWLGMLMLHTLFTLEHNAICDRLKDAYPRWTDEQLFQRARLVNAALLAKIHTMEWTPAVISHPTTVTALRANWFGLAEERVHKLFGRISDSEVVSGIPGSETNHYGIPYSLTEEFTAVYRMHPLLPDDWTFRSAQDNHMLAKKAFSELTGHQAVEMVDQMEMADLFYSFGTEHPGVVTMHNFPRDLQMFKRPDGRFLDLGAVDILRIREIGVPRYCEFRRLLHLPVPKTFDELTDNPQWAAEIERVYGGDLEKVDTMIGMYAEPKPPGFAFSDTAFRIFVLMASRRLNSDRFLTKDYTARVYTQEGLDWIDDSEMGDVLLRHLPALRPALRGCRNAFAPWAVAGAPA